MADCRRWTIAAFGLAAALLGPPAVAQEYRDIDGFRYQISQVTIPRQIPITDTVPQQQTTYRQQVTTETIQHQQLYTVPVTQYQIVSRLHGRWNPFVTPYWTHHYEPVTVWQQQVANVQIPVSKVAWTPETRTVQTPVTKWQTVNEIVERRTPIGPSSTAMAAKPLSSSGPTATIAALPSGSSAHASTAESPPIAGGQMMPSDPPRAANTWQSPSSNSRY